MHGVSAHHVICSQFHDPGHTEYVQFAVAFGLDILSVICLFRDCFYLADVYRNPIEP